MSRRFRNSFLAAVLGVGLPLTSGNAIAQGLNNIDLHGFVSQGFLLSVNNNFIEHSSDGTFQFTEVGLNVSTKLNSKLRMGVQLFSRDFGDSGNFDIALDWAYADYRISNSLGVRAGKIKLATGLYNETQDVDSVRTSILMPTGVYNPNFRDFVLAIAGVSAYGSASLSSAGNLDYKAFMGFTDASVDGSLGKLINDSGAMSLNKFRSKRVFGAGLVWNTPVQGLRLSGTGYQTDFEFAADLSPALQQLGMPASTRAQSRDFRIGVGSIELVRGNLTLAAEYFRMSGGIEDEVFGPLNINQESYYAQGSYRVNPWFEIGTYYSVLYNDKDDKAGANSDPAHRAWQKDLALSLRFDINDNWSFKLEGHAINGTAQLYMLDNPDGFEKNWGLFAAKTTFTF